MSTYRILTLSCGILLMAGITLLAAPTKAQDEADKYAKQLKTAKDAKAKIEALKELGRLGSIQVGLTKPYVYDIIKFLDDKDATVRGEAAHTLGRIEPENKKEIVEKLTKMVKEEKDLNVRTNVVHGLSAMGSDAKDAVPTLREAMQKLDKKTDKQEMKMLKEAIGAINGK